jgi:uncharacterized protein (DUF4415 family)
MNGIGGPKPRMPTTAAGIARRKLPTPYDGPGIAKSQVPGVANAPRPNMQPGPATMKPRTPPPANPGAAQQRVGGDSHTARGAGAYEHRGGGIYQSQSRAPTQPMIPRQPNPLDPRLNMNPFRDSLNTKQQDPGNLQYEKTNYNPMLERMQQAQSEAQSYKNMMGARPFDNGAGVSAQAPAQGDVGTSYQALSAETGTSGGGLAPEGYTGDDTPDTQLSDQVTSAMGQLFGLHRSGQNEGQAGFSPEQSREEWNQSTGNAPPGPVMNAGYGQLYDAGGYKDYVQDQQKGFNEQLAAETGRLEQARIDKEGRILDGETDDAFKQWLEGLMQGIPELDQGHVDERVRADADRRSQAMGRMLRAQAAMAAKNGASVESMMGMQGEAMARTGAESADAAAKIRMDADLANLKQQGDAYQARIQALAWRANNAASAQERQSAFDMQRKLMLEKEKVDGRMMELQDEINSRIGWNDAFGLLGGAASTVGGTWAGAQLAKV